MSKRFLLTIVTVLVIGIAASVAIYLAKGYRFSSQNGTIQGTGILSITSIPDQASVYLDGHLSTATNSNINSLLPKEYSVRIIKEGFIPWEKKVAVREGLVTEIKATLFRAIPTVYPLTYSGAENSHLSADGSKLVYVVPVTEGMSLEQQKRTGLWVWQMSDRPIAFARGAEPHQIAPNIPGVDYTQAKFRFSPDSNQLLVTLPDRSYLLETGRLNDPPRDITPTVEPTTRSWDEDQKAKDTARLQLIKDVNLRNTASSSATLKWSPDESKFMYSKDGKNDFKVVDLGIGPKPSEQKTFDLPKSTGVYSWLPDSEHLILVEPQGDQKTPSPSASPTPSNNIKLGKVSILESDGANKSEIYVGNFNLDSVFAWPDSSRIVLISSIPTATGSQPNLFGINLK